MNLKDRSRDELIRDIHDALDRGERAQAASEIRLHSLVENLPHGILVLDSDQRLIVANTTGLSCLVVLTEGAGVGDRIVALGGEPLQTFTTLGGMVCLRKSPPRGGTSPSRRPSTTIAGRWLFAK